MCLGIPGKIVEIEKQEKGEQTQRVGLIDFNGNRVKASLALVPESQIGAWVLVHAGYAIAELDEEEARKTWEWLEEVDVIDEMPQELRKPEGAANE